MVLCLTKCVQKLLCQRVRRLFEDVLYALHCGDIASRSAKPAHASRFLTRAPRSLTELIAVSRFSAVLCRVHEVVECGRINNLERVFA
jgi:hypothetical protein